MTRIILSFLLIFFAGLTLFAQQPTPRPPKSDSLKVVQIISAERYGFKKLDSVTELLLMVGNVALKQENTLFYSDSSVFNRNAKIVEAFGNVHIIDNDSIDVYSDYLLYHTDTKIATLKKRVRLTDGKSNLFTEELEYDLNEKVGIYRKGGRVVNGTSVLTSMEGTYYADIKDVYFQQDVVLTDPKYNLRSDSLLYNTVTEMATFIAKTYIEDSAKRTIVTSEGYYDLKNKNASFGRRPVIRDGPVTIIANQVNTDDNTGINVLIGNAVFRDTAQGVSVLANSIVSNRNTGSMVATQRPLMIIKQDNDSTFITADTLYSGRLSELPATVTDSVSADSLSQVQPSIDTTFNDSLSKVSRLPDSSATSRDTLSRIRITPDTLLQKVVIRDTSLAAPPPSDSTAPLVAMMTDTTGNVNKNDSADRFFRAYRNVRIFSDSLQAVCDSLFYSGKDSIFRLFRDPIIWASNSQVTGDTIYMQTKNKKPHQMYVFEDGMMINKTGTDMYNQIRGNRLFGYFLEGEIDNVRARGNAESIYYAKDSEDRLVGINKATSDIIDMRFKNKELNRVVFISAVTGTMLPYRQATEQDKRLRNFDWQDSKRPKSKFELFGN